MGAIDARSNQSRRRRVTAIEVGVGIVVAAVGGVAVALTWDRDSSSSTPPEALPTEVHPRGGVVYLDYEARRIGMSEPDGTNEHWLTEPVLLAPSSYAVVSPNGQELVTEDGLLLDLTIPGLQVPHHVEAVSLLGEGAAVPRQPWADHGHALIVTGQTDHGPVVQMVDPSSGVSLAEWEGVRAAAGDPAGPGAALEVVADASELGVTPTHRFLPSDRVELRDAHGTRTVLTTAQFGAAVGLTRKQQLWFGGLSFSPDGALMAVAGGTVATFVEDMPSAGFAVFDSRGRIVYAQKAERGQWWLEWTGPRNLVAVFGYTRNPTRTRILSLTLPPPGDGAVMSRIVWLPDDPGTAAWAWSGCAAAPSGAELVCGSEFGWLLVDLDGATAQVLQSVPGRPLAWVRG